jgi:hypothetical protein
MATVKKVRIRKSRSKKSTIPVEVVDVKQAQANDVPVVPLASVVPLTSVVEKSDAGSARAEGLRLYKLAGRPAKSDFIRVLGPNGAKQTWEQRAKALGLASAEEAAEKFQSILAKATK